MNLTIKNKAFLLLMIIMVALIVIFILAKVFAVASSKDLISFSQICMVSLAAKVSILATQDTINRQQLKFTTIILLALIFIIVTVLVAKAIILDVDTAKWLLTSFESFFSALFIFTFKQQAKP